MVKFAVISEDIQKIKTDVLALVFCEDERLSGKLEKLDKIFKGALSKAVDAKRFLGKDKEILFLDGQDRIAAQKMVLIGLGKQKDLSLDKYRQAAATVVKATRNLKLEQAVFVLEDNKAYLPAKLLYAVLEGAFIAAYKFKGLHKPDPEKEKTKKEAKQFLVNVNKLSDYPEHKHLLNKAEILQRAINQAKDLVNLPANIVTPSYLVNKAEEIADKNKNKVKIKIMDFIQALKAGFGGFCAVARGTEEPPKIIILEYKGAGASKDIFGLVGKGITFDSGGISLKPADGMGEMKTDMAGAASVLGTFKALVELGVKKNIIAIIPATENLPSGRAYKPGDIITMLNGTTVEINSTDAEGRLILADALSHIQAMGAKKIIELATLTGACVVALGQVRTGVMTNSQEFVNSFMKASEETGEKYWQLPMDEEYSDLLKSTSADTLNNSTIRQAGTISGGKFLEKFIEKGNQWIHCDIAGTAYLSKPQRYLDKNATGVAIRTLVEYLSN